MLRPMQTLAQLQQTNTALSSCGCSSAQKIVRKYKKAHKRRLQKKEYRNLQKIVPTVASKGKISKVTVIEEAIRYIDQLHNALAQRLQSSQDKVKSLKKQKRKRVKKSERPCARKAWSADEKAAVKRHFSKYYYINELPGKAAIEAAMQIEKALINRTWRNCLQLVFRPTSLHISSYYHP
ncbi:hypothetical protein CAPTEDRAFT_225013 [Capitella teleta]|uniref:BHLH domain-containing protein n=1 Tax=Capitella teleta TaxID=283909 RepID=R7V145_CAPTE|nr:hypothetical protein CAPTEDRAFT_225013 [Capitella teleta]|eukprot:ELU12192.1 hypothetical protein CAPTEDRAFT_225013 [Capitella teleta]